MIQIARDFDSSVMRADISSIATPRRVRSGALPRSGIDASTLTSRRFDFPLPDGKIVVEVEGQEPDWLYTVLQQVQSVAALPPNWDSYGGEALTFEAALASLGFLADQLKESAVPPSIVPSSTGGLQLEWHRRGCDLEITFGPAGAFSASFENSKEGSWEMTEESIEPDRLAAAVERVSERPIGV
jgi:hypothetical protein